MVNLLFICRYNRFRSQVAEAYFKKINKNKKYKTQGAGLIQGRPESAGQIRVAKEFGLDIRGKPQGISQKLLKWYDIALIMADDFPERNIFRDAKRDGKKVICLKVRDGKEGNEKSGRKVIRKIIKKVNSFNRKLEARKI